MSIFSFNAVCRECGAEFVVANTAEGSPEATFEYAEPFTCNGRRVYLTTLRCPACGAVRVAQADSDESLEVLRESYALLAKINGAQGRSESLSGRYKTKVQRLAKLRSKLAKQLEGKVAISDGGEEVKVFVDAKPGM